VQAEVAVQIDHVHLRHGDARPLPVIQRVAMRDNHVEAIHGAALEETDENGAGRGGKER